MPETADFKRGVRCMFTLNNPGNFKPDFSQGNEVIYAIYQLEEGAETKTPHFQGVIFFSRQVTAKHVNKKYLDNRAKLKRCDSVDGAIKYCTKKDRTYRDGPWEYGLRSAVVEQGSNKRARPDFNSQKELLDWSDTEYKDKYYHNIKRQMVDASLKMERTWQTKFICLYGPSGTGKSLFAKELWPKAYYVQKESSTRNLWFDGYDGQEVMIVDDYHNTFSFTVFKELINHTGYHLPVKGGKAPMVASLVVVLSNTPPNEWYPNIDSAHQAAVRRRMESPIGKCVRISTNLVEHTWNEEIQKYNRTWCCATLVKDLRDFISFDADKTIPTNTIDGMPLEERVVEEEIPDQQPRPTSPPDSPLLFEQSREPSVQRSDEEQFVEEASQTVGSQLIRRMNSIGDGCNSSEIPNDFYF
jgi:RNA helicase/Putative viral replication protein